MSPMGTDEDAVEADPGSEAVSRANGDASALAAAGLQSSEGFSTPAEEADAAPGGTEVADAPEPEESYELLAEPPEAAVARADRDDLGPVGLQEGDELGDAAARDDSATFYDPISETDQEPEDRFATPEEMSQMVFVDVVLHLPATHPVVVLQEADAPFRELRIPVGGAEGIAISYAARGIATPRPLTHELFTRVLEEYGMTLDVVRITEVRGTAFTSEMVISGRLGMRLIDCRPSDAIALALRQRLPVPIMVDPVVLAIAGTDPIGAN